MKEERKEDDGELWRHESDDEREREKRKTSRYLMGERKEKKKNLNSKN